MTDACGVAMGMKIACAHVVRKCCGSCRHLCELRFTLPIETTSRTEARDTFAGIREGSAPLFSWAVVEMLFVRVCRGNRGIVFLTLEDLCVGRWKFVPSDANAKPTLVRTP